MVNSTKTSYHIQAGKLNNDYFVIQNKPNLGALLIDENSVVILINKAGKKRVCLPGFQFVKNGEQILHTFNLGFHHFFWGPAETENPFREHPSDLDFNQSHLHSLKINQTKWHTKDGAIVVPLFSIFYDFSFPADKSKIRERSLTISDYFSANNINGELQNEINKFIGERVTNIWKILLENTNTDQLTFSTNLKSSLLDDLITEVNTRINTKTAEDTSDTHKLNGSYRLDHIKHMKQWNMPNIKVYLIKIWVRKNIPKNEDKQSAEK